jgi:hypothetical protein
MQQEKTRKNYRDLTGLPWKSPVTIPAFFAASRHACLCSRASLTNSSSHASASWSAILRVMENSPIILLWSPCAQPFLMHSAKHYENDMLVST